jgi:hypothetical protein
MNEGKGRAFKVMVHLLRKAIIDHPSSGNLSHHGLPRMKIASTVRIKEEQDEGIGRKQVLSPQDSYLSVWFM